MAAGSLVMEEREELMVSPTAGNVSLKTAHFLVPSVTSIYGPVAAPSLDSLTSAATTYKDLPFKVNYLGWRHPQEIWTTWVHQMHSLHHSTWKELAFCHHEFHLHHSPMRRSDSLFVEKWCPLTPSCSPGRSHYNVERYDGARGLFCFGGISFLSSWKSRNGRNRKEITEGAIENF
ncbi:UNVERIFIED_CONTAM: hypothetical protein Sradi_2269700 [Sesamum radiatum]|uniref:Aminotransferase-like plant mobile domain-containing protein n=1 Tax=Sesamum radiatum TaxID=300843 RepID=A0AAW2T3F5_SESRA